MTIRISLHTSCLTGLAGGVLFLCLAGSLQAAERPNILFIFTDDHASHSISAYGSRVNQTPNLDRIASEGMLFENCFCTNSICGPSRAVILTGKHSHLNGFLQNGNKFDCGQQVFPKLLQKVGYQTAVIGKWHLGHGGRSDPQGFDYWEILQGQGPYYNPPMFKNGELVRHIGYTTDIITDLALDWLQAIPHVREGAGGDDRQRVGEERLAHLGRHRHRVDGAGEGLVVEQSLLGAHGVGVSWWGVGRWGAGAMQALWRRPVTGPPVRVWSDRTPADSANRGKPRGAGPAWFRGGPGSVRCP